MKTENKVPQSNTKILTVNERLDRLERLVVRLLLAMPLDTHTARLIDIQDMPRGINEALRNRYNSVKPFAGTEADYAKDCVFALCANDIQEIQATLSRAEAKRDAAQQKVWRAKLEAEKTAAEKVLADAQAKLAQERVDMPESN